MQVLTGADHFGAQAGGTPNWVEHLSVPDLSVGTYSLPAGSVDTQDPHTEDEIYVVLRGRGALATDDATADAAPGSVIYVPAGENHHFVRIVEDLVVLVLFAPAEGSRVSSADG
ncbi:MAG TPA: cupin domain-containing protein [Candidatus Dormibacteraeota bacterium]|jgi:mannose-6-phosphate isomerase-like protein (cupin superfamily)|nr:cupin domain-containing protein [Candidatus Dormibacteraeota bacterium]